MAINNGCDQNDGTFYSQYLPTALTQGLVNESQVNIALQRAFLQVRAGRQRCPPALSTCAVGNAPHPAAPLQRFRTGAFDPPMHVPWSNLTAADMHTNASASLALDAAKQAIVLLKNECVSPPFRSADLC